MLSWRHPLISLATQLEFSYLIIFTLKTQGQFCCGQLQLNAASWKTKKERDEGRVGAGEKEQARKRREIKERLNICCIEVQNERRNYSRD